MTARLPTFLLIGAMKAGTTSLYRYLATHPDIFLPQNKEPDFFVAEKTWSRGLSWYERLFEGADGAVAVGEGSTSYTKCTEFPGVPERIARVIPDARLIYLVRHPVQRMQSMYVHNVIVGRERQPVDVALLENPMYLGASRYDMQLRAFDEYFDQRQILVLTTERLQGDTPGALAEVASFLGLPRLDGFDLNPRRDNESATRRAETGVTKMIRRLPGHQALLAAAPAGLRERSRTALTKPLALEELQMSEDTRLRLEDLLRDDVRRLRDRAGPDVDVWGLTADQQQG